jgi:predicted MFS family arabinose efflux permease
MAGAAAASTLAGSWGLLLASRIAEGVGYLLVFVAGPVVLTRTTQGGIRSAALALWGTCVPTGLAIAAVAGGALASRWTWNRWLALTALALLITAAVTTVVLPRLPNTPVPHPHSHRHRQAGTWSGPLRLGAAYASLSLVGVAVVTVLPPFLTERREVTPTVAGTLVALVCLGSALGGLAASWLLRRGAPLSSLVPLGAVMPLACLPAFSAAFPLAVSATAATVVLLVDGLLISAVFAALPATVSREHVDVAGGILNQLGSAGILLGPPLYGLAITAAGWDAVAAATLIVGGLGTILLLPTGAHGCGNGTADRTSRPPDATDSVDARQGPQPVRKSPDVTKPHRHRT